MSPYGTDDPALARLADLVAAADRIVVFTGAGMSAESGVPTFRDADGLWTIPPIDGVPIEDIVTPEGFRDHFPQFLQLYRMRIREGMALAPHDGHRVLARWEAEGRVHAVITQNVDGFHGLAGSRRVHELHGTIREIRCAGCGAVRPAIDYLDDDGTTCGCGDHYRPSVVMFGEALPMLAVVEALEAATEADLFLVIGTTLLVHPAAELPVVAKASGAKLAIINLGETPLDGVADVVVRRRIGEALAHVDARLAATASQVAEP